jgi:putative hemolysin
VPETLTGMELLDNFRESDVHMAFVIDEYGEVQGIVTLQDLIEAITGEFRPRDPRPPGRAARGRQLAARRPHPGARTEGPAAAGFGARGGARPLPHLSGMMMLLTGRLPKVADTVTWEGWHFEIVDMDGKTIDKVLASAQPVALHATPPVRTGSVGTR